MGFATTYLEKHQQVKFDITEAPSGLLCYIVIIPAYNEPAVQKTLESLLKCKPVEVLTEVYVLFNYPETDSRRQKDVIMNQYRDVMGWCCNNKLKTINFTALLAPDLPEKLAGVGLARKILMDLAIQRFNQINKPEGVILSLDADTLVPVNYLAELHARNKKKSETNCFVFNFEHPLSGTEFLDEVYEASALYELHLRYYKQILKSTGFPYYQYTIGSCFAVRAEVYTKVGGMNKRKAGEDFYFLQKVFLYGHIDFVENIILQPSSRCSDRVPFGTGAAISKIVDSNKPEFATYHPDLFMALKVLFDLVPSFYNSEINEVEDKIKLLPVILVNFLENNYWRKNIFEIKQNTSSVKSFVKRFYTWFDAFKVIKFLNFARATTEYQIGICAAVNKYLSIKEPTPVMELLGILRDMDIKD